MYRLKNIAFLIVVAACTHSLQSRTRPVVTDTTAVLLLAIQTAIEWRKLPEDGALFPHHSFLDTIWTATDSLLNNRLPMTIDSINLRLTPEASIHAAIRQSRVPGDQPNYLYLCCFEKHDSVYEVSVQSRSGVPFGGGGSVDFTIVRRGDSLIVKSYLSNSIN